MMKDAGKRILVVEDEALIAMELADRLGAMGYEVCGTVSRGEVALERIPELRPDLVLMDVNLAGAMDGVETTRQLRERCETPVVFLTAYSDADLIGRATRAGSFGYLVKPFDERELRATIEVAIARSASERDLKSQAMVDALTGLYNRRFLEEALPREIARAQREGWSLAVAMLDIDHFKRLNDAHGHGAGDRAIGCVANAIRDAVRESDLVCRFGGEEFTVVLPGASLEQAVRKIESVCKAIQAMPIVFDGKRIALTLSAGVAAAHGASAHPEALLRAADEALYRAKRTGRNRVCAAESDSSALVAAG